ncbi:MULTISPECIES: DNA mismatch repair endonuclease MutH [Legionella]|uniref:DNA mismatch repair endonuclease MutH n=1 Tax=Legionella TaxID=445 RepID=UPI003531DDB0
MTVTLKKQLMNEEELLQRCQLLAGLSFGQLACELSLNIPIHASRAKGWLGQAVEIFLGATAGSKAIPDFHTLGIELKTLPVNHLGKPAESTFVTSISLLTVGKEKWLTSQCYSKLKKVLWLPIEGERDIPLPQRRIGSAILWSPTVEQERILAEDWLELTAMIGMGRLEEIHAGIGRYLQVRPKAANGRSLCYGFDATGNKVLTLPRGFYLRSSFTATILASE